MDTQWSGWLLALSPKGFFLNLRELKEQFVKCIADWFHHHSKSVVETMLWVPAGN